jgi:hypothetical protein
LLPRLSRITRAASAQGPHLPQLILLPLKEPAELRPLFVKPVEFRLIRLRLIGKKLLARVASRGGLQEANDVFESFGGDRGVHEADIPRLSQERCGWAGSAIGHGLRLRESVSTQRTLLRLCR